MEAGHAYQPLRLDDPREITDGDSTDVLADTIGTADAQIERVAEMAPLQAALRKLDERQRRIIRMRFIAGCTQDEVAGELGLSQMHVSRLERSALQQLRTVMNSPQPG